MNLAHRPEALRVLATAGDIEATIATIRIVAPLSLMAERGRLQLRLRSFHECLAADLEWADVLVIQRGLDARSARLLERMHASGGAVVFEIDDLLTEPAPQLRHADVLRQSQRWLRHGLGQADVVSVSTARLGLALQALVRRWVEVPNYGLAAADGPVNGQAGSGAAGAAPGGRTTLFFASSDHVDLAFVAAALRALQAAPPAPFDVLAVGPVADDLRAAGVHVEARAGLPRTQFLALLRTLRGGAAVVPVGATAFDACKSAIKFFDCALAGVPVICSARPPYSDVVVQGVNGWLVDESTDPAAAWTAALRQALSAPQSLAPLAVRAAADVAAHHSLDQTAEAWHQLLATLPARRRPALPAATAWQRGVERVALALRRLNRRRLKHRAGS